MRSDNRAQFIVGLLLVLLGIWFIAVRQLPQLRPWQSLQLELPFYVIGAGAIILVVGLLTGDPRMTIPASVVAGIGAILYYQVTSGDWASWLIAWTLLPGFVGIGTILEGLLGEETRRNIGRGIYLVVVSAVLFLIFAAIFQRLPILGPFGPSFILILLGVYIIGRAILRRLDPGSRQSDPDRL